MLNSNQYLEMFIKNVRLPNTKFLRVGVPGDGKCLIHALLFLWDSKYVTYDLPTRQLKVEVFLRDFLKTITQDKWQRFQLGEGSIQIQLHLRNLLENTFQNGFLDTIFQKIDPTDSFYTLLHKLQRELQPYIPPTQLSDIINAITKLQQQLFNDYKQTLLTCQSLGYQEIQYFSDFYKTNIAIVDKEGNSFWGMKYNPNYSTNYMVCNLDGMHWEPVLIVEDNKACRNMPHLVMEQLL